ncbi:hypothetical protein [Burkholderia gladioli]|uniref:hypothetical protein n=1 Tax=Burkholderia gladioli TaxID=28095 RepID=UPI000F52E1AD|nr:hypothetical protein [Burkholderia gladioli]
MMARDLKPRGRPITTFRIDEGGASSAEPAWMVRFNGAGVCFVNSSLDRALASAFAWRVAMMPKWHLLP